MEFGERVAEIVKAELIETLWNVNTYSDTKEGRGFRINRNIVECKYILRLISF